MAPSHGLVGVSLYDLRRKLLHRWNALETLHPVGHRGDPLHRQHHGLQGISSHEGDKVGIVCIFGDGTRTFLDRTLGNLPKDPVDRPPGRADERSEQYHFRKGRKPPLRDTLQDHCTTHALSQQVIRLLQLGELAEHRFQGSHIVVETPDCRAHPRRQPMSGLVEAQNRKLLIQQILDEMAVETDMVVITVTDDGSTLGVRRVEALRCNTLAPGLEIAKPMPATLACDEVIQSIKVQIVVNAVGRLVGSTCEPTQRV